MSCSLSAGIGAQERALRQLNIPYEVRATCELDKDAILSYAAMRFDLEEEMKHYDFPSKEEMIEELQSRNIGYDFQKSKHSITARMNEKKVQQYYLADKLTNNLGDISKVEKLPYADMVFYSFPCFVPGTMVLTDNGFKNIEDIQEGDMVLTHTNQYQKVIKPMKNYCDSYVYKIDAMCSDPIYTTAEHPFYVRERYRTWDNSKRRYDRKFKNPEWVKAKDLTKDYYVGVAINQKSEIPKWDGITFTWNGRQREEHSNKLNNCMDKEDFWWIIGRYIGDGWIKNSGGIIICCEKSETSEITNVLDRLNWGYTIADERTVNKIHISFKEIGVFCEQFGRGAANKRLTKDIINLPINLLQGFLDGYMSADGCCAQNKYKATSVSKELIYGIAQCVAKVYNTPFSVSFYRRKPTCIIEGRIVNQKDSYNIAFKLNKEKQDKAFYEDGYIWCPINNISTKEYNGYVYNMEVENDNSYVVQNIIVHNCTDLSVAGRGEGMTLKCGNCGHSWPIDFSNTSEKNICPNCGHEVTSSTRSGLLGQVQRLLSISYQENTLPKYLILENVKNLVGKKFKPQFDAWCHWLDSIGYNTYYKVLNAKNYGIAQNRERIFAVSIRKDIDDGTFQFPQEIPLTTRLKDILEKNVDERYYISNERVEQILNSDFLQEKIRNRNNTSDNTPIRLTNIYGEQFGTGYAGNVWDTDGLSPTLQTAQGGNRQPLIVDEEPFIVASRGRNPDNPSDRTSGIHTEQRLEPNLNGTTNTITTVAKDNYVCEPIVCEERRDEGIRFFKDDCCGTLRTIDACGDKRVLEPDMNPRLVGGIGEKNFGKQYRQGNRVYDSDAIAMALNAQPVGNTGGYSYLYAVEDNNNIETIKVRNQATEFAGYTDVAGTLMARDYKGFGNQEMTAIVEKDVKWRIRKLTPTECWRLMGFTDEDCNRAAKYVSASALYKQAGNSICTSCLVGIFYSLLFKDSSDAYAKYLVDFNS